MALGDVYKKIAGTWVLQGNIRGASGVAGALNDLSDVSGSPSTGDVLRKTAGDWSPATLGYADVGAAASGHAHSGYATDSHAHDHGAITGLGDDDHTQYLRADGTRDLTGTQVVRQLTPAAADTYSAGTWTVPFDTFYSEHHEQVTRQDAANSWHKMSRLRAAGAAILSGDWLGVIQFLGGIGSGSVEEGARIGVVAAENFSSGNTESKLHVSVGGRTKVFPTAGPIVQTYDVADSPATWTKPDYLDHIVVEVIGGGGGGGGTFATGTGEQAAGGGGGGGGYSRKVFLAADLPASCTATVGAKGVGVSGDSGTAGVASSFAGTGITTVQGGGGAGGTRGADTTGVNRNEGGAGGESSGGDLNAAGQGGGLGSVISGQRVPAGAGGNAGNGSGGARAANDAAGYNANGYGGGGSAASSTPNIAARAGGDGAPGVVIISEYY